MAVSVPAGLPILPVTVVSILPVTVIPILPVAVVSSILSVGGAGAGKFIVLVSLYDLLHQGVADDVACGEVDKFDPVHALEDGHGDVKTGAPVRSQVFLRSITSDDCVRAETEPGEKHLHLFRCRVLCLIEDDVGIVEGSSAHISERRDLDQAFFHVCLELFRSHDLIEGIVKRAEIGIDLALQITR